MLVSKTSRDLSPKKTRSLYLSFKMLALCGTEHCFACFYFLKHRLHSVLSDRFFFECLHVQPVKWKSTIVLCGDVVGR